MERGIKDAMDMYAVLCLMLSLLCNILYYGLIS